MIKFENPKNGRFYYLYMQLDMFGDRVLTVIRGGTHFRNNRVIRHYGFNCERDIQKAIEDISKVRTQHGYVLVS